MIKFFTAFTLLGTCFVSCSVLASHYPLWWEEYGILDPTQEGDDFSPVNVGQLKFFATQASLYFNTELAGGAGPVINALVENFLEDGDGLNEDFAPVNVGQLKAVAKPFWDRLSVSKSAGLLESQLILNGLRPGEYTTFPVIYPWIAAESTDAYLSPANVGQLKMVFSFELDWGLEHPAIDSGLQEPNYSPLPPTAGAGEIAAMGMQGGGGWLHFWFGSVFFPDLTEQTGWVHHAQHRWIFLVDDPSGDFWFVYPPFGSLFTGPSHYPAMFSTALNSWITFNVETHEPRWFYHHQNGEWFFHHWEDSFSTNRDSFAANVKILAGIGELGYAASGDAATWSANSDVDAAMGQDGLLYLMLPDRGPFVVKETLHEVLHHDIDLITFH